MHQSLQGATFHIEHVVPRVKGGTSDSSNLALACPSCNMHKADRISSQPSSSITAVAFYNPRSEVWVEHFEWDAYTLVGKTEVGRVTVPQRAQLLNETILRITYDHENKDVGICFQLKAVGNEAKPS